LDWRPCTCEESLEAIAAIESICNSLELCPGWMAVPERGYNTCWYEDGYVWFGYECQWEQPQNWPDECGEMPTYC
jgi:hypothetical protein